MNIDKYIRKGKILESIENLNTFTLNELLADRPYQKVSKTVFLEGMEDAFVQFRERGDTRLERHESICDSRTCSNRGCLGYAFRGNQSGSLMSLIFEEEHEEFTDICPCYDFRPLDGTVPDGHRISLAINSAGLTKAEIRELIDNMTAALEELKQLPEKNIKWDTCLSWLERHEKLCLKSLWTPEDDVFFDFTFFYDGLENLKEYVEMIPECITASEEFPGVENEDALLNWLVKYEELHIKDGRFENFDWLTVESTRIPDGKTVGMDFFKPIEHFKLLSLQTYWPLLGKYTTFTKEDEPQEDEFGNPLDPVDKNGDRPTADEYFQYCDSLSYHLKKRGMVLG